MYNGALWTMSPWFLVAILQVCFEDGCQYKQWYCLFSSFLPPFLVAAACL